MDDLQEYGMIAAACMVGVLALLILLELFGDLPILKTAKKAL